MSNIKLTTTDDLLLCTACGAQYEEDDGIGKSECRICEVCIPVAGYLQCPHLLPPAMLSGAREHQKIAYTLLEPVNRIQDNSFHHRDNHLQHWGS
jgi:hypothetical protein